MSVELDFSSPLRIFVAGAGTMGHGLALLMARAGHDVVLMDIALPGLNGVEATRRIKESHPSVSVLVLTAYDSEEFIFAILRAKAAGYLLKNVRGRELLNAIRAVYEGNSVLHPTVAKKVLEHFQPEGEKSPPAKRMPLSRREMEVVELGKSIEINILYDLGKWDIRADAAVELDDMVKFLKDNPEIKIELGSHTDARGSAKSNQILSQKRAESAVQYMIDNGISKERITAKGYGETKLKNRCADGVNCSEEEHQANRRSEVKIIAM